MLGNSISYSSQSHCASSTIVLFHLLPRIPPCDFQVESLTVFYFLNEGRKAEKETKRKAGVSKVPAGDDSRDGQEEQSGYGTRETILLLHAPGTAGRAGAGSSFTGWGGEWGIGAKAAGGFGSAELSRRFGAFTASFCFH